MICTIVVGGGVVCSFLGGGGLFTTRIRGGVGAVVPLGHRSTGAKSPYPYPHAWLEFGGKWAIFQLLLEQEGYPHMFLGGQSPV